MSEAFDHSNKAEAGAPSHLERLQTAGGHPNDRTQPALPVVHRTFANPAPLGLLSFATGIFLISLLGVHARGIQTPNILVGLLMFFGGVCQFIAGIMEFITGNTVGMLQVALSLVTDQYDSLVLQSFLPTLLSIFLMP
jgi:uncharacterized protein